jgi:hypothetical protein
MKGVSVFATCSFPEYDPEAGGIPVRSSNGFPRYRLKYPLVHKMPSTFPDWNWMKLPQDEFFKRYADMVARREQRIRDEAADIRVAEGTDVETPIVLLCFEQLAKKPGSWCHRSAFSAAWQVLNPSERVNELGARAQAETHAQETLF